MIAYPNAKINLGLNILRKRDDGYHDIESVFYPISWCDMLEIVPVTGNGIVTFTSSGIEIPANSSPNLCEQVYHLFHEEFDISSVQIHLHKVIPIGAGLGGGSADAAFCAIVLNKLFDLDVSVSRLEEIVAKVGSDCPFFIQNQATYVTGRGEELEPIDTNLSGLWIYLVHPNIHIGTKEAYSGVETNTPEKSLKVLLKKPISNWQGLVKNDFEASIFPSHPRIEEIKNDLVKNGAVYASMTGSGSTVFGLFEKEPEQMDLADSYTSKIIRL